MMTRGAHLPWLLFVFLGGCLGLGQTQLLKPEEIYKRDMEITVNGMKFYGVGVVPPASKYEIQIKTQGKLDLFILKNCHREWTESNHQKEVKYTYVPNTEIETKDACPMMFVGLEKEKGRHSWGMIEFEKSDATLESSLACNGVLSKGRGVSVCQSHAGLVQRISFAAPMKVTPDERCNIPISADGKMWEFPIVVGECVYEFLEPVSSKWHRLVTFGYDQILVRGE